MYWYIRKRIEHKDYEAVRNKSLSEYITYKLESDEYEKEIIEWLRMWLNNRDKDKSILVRYEDALENTYREIRKLLAFLKINCSESNLRHIIEMNSFERVSSRKPGCEDTNSFFRKGVSGEWKETFSDQQKETFSVIGEDVITRLGYNPTIQCNTIG